MLVDIAQLAGTFMKRKWFSLVRFCVDNYLSGEIFADVKFTRIFTFQGDSFGFGYICSNRSFRETKEHASVLEGLFKRETECAGLFRLSYDIQLDFMLFLGENM